MHTDRCFAPLLTTLLLLSSGNKKHVGLTFLLSFMHTATNTVTSMTVPTIPRRTPSSGVSCTRTAVDEAGSGKRAEAGDVIAGVIVLNYFIGGELLKGKSPSLIFAPTNRTRP